MKKYPKRGSFQDVKLNAEAVGFQIKESYKKARTNIAYSIVKKGCKMQHWEKSIAIYSSKILYMI